MLSILAGAFLVSAAHAILPDHWLPMILISRAEKWTQAETLWITALVTIPHMVSTILLGLLVGLIGFRLSASFEALMEVVAPSMFILIGLIYVYRNYSGDDHHHHGADISSLGDRSKKAVVTFMATALFFSPCVPMGSYFFIVGAEGIANLALVSVIYVVVTLGILLLMVALGRKGVERIQWHFLEHNENLITGIVLIALGLFVFLFEA
jgi:cadmium resistance protein CadD (predicted permease)